MSLWKGYQKCMEWLCFLCPVQCTFLRQNHFCHKELQKLIKKEPVLEPKWQSCDRRAATFDWLALWWQGACGRTHPSSLCLKMTAPCRGRSGPFTVKIKCNRRAPSVCRSTKKHCCPNTFVFLLYSPASPDFIHIFASMGQRSALPWAASVRPIHAQQTGCEVALCWPWMVKATKARLYWLLNGSQVLVGLFVHTTLKRQSLLPSRAYTEKCTPLLECFRKIKCVTCSIFMWWSGSNDICKYYHLVKPLWSAKYVGKHVM